jgi:hypothetical protein
MYTRPLIGVALLASAIISQSVSAAPEPQLSGIITSIFGADFPSAVTSDQPFFKDIIFDGPAFAPAVTTMAEINEQFGGTIVAPDSTQSWLCYDAGNTRTWFYSADVDPAGKPVVNMIVTELATTPAAAAGCATVTAAITPIDPNLPGLGATLADLKIRFGDAKPDANGHLNYGFVASGDGGFIQNIFYTLKDGVVTAVSFGQWNVQEGDTL